MTRVRAESFTISLDGYGAGPNQVIDRGETGRERLRCGVGTQIGPFRRDMGPASIG